MASTQEELQEVFVEMLSTLKDAPPENAAEFIVGFSKEMHHYMKEKSEEYSKCTLIIEGCFK